MAAPQPARDCSSEMPSASPSRVALELAEPLRAADPVELRAPLGSRWARRRNLATVAGLVLALVGSAIRVNAFAAPELREPDWPLVFKGFSETLSTRELAQLENDVDGRDMPALMHNAIEIPKPSCMAHVDECLNNQNSSLAEADMENFFVRLDKCIARAAKCAREAEDEMAERALAAANEDLLAAVKMLESGGAAGAKKLAGAFRGAAGAVAREFPVVAAFLRDVAERIIAFLARNLPLWVAAAKEIGGDFAEKLLQALQVLQERLPGLANRCKCGLGEGAAALKDASVLAVQLLQAELPKWTDEAQKVGMGAILFAEGFLKDLPKVVDMCKTELEKQLAKDGRKAAIQKALVVGAAVGAVGFWMHQHHKETQALKDAEASQSAERRSLRAKASESKAAGWPQEDVLAMLYRHGLWEDFGRQAGRTLANGWPASASSSNSTAEENIFRNETIFRDHFLHPLWDDRR
jgi:hypothetical protein